MSLTNHNLLILLSRIWFCLMCFFALSSLAQPKPLTFNRLDITHGLSNNSVLSIAQDSTGYIWFGTKYGLNRFDGRTFKIYKKDPENKTSISTNDYIKKLIPDSHNTMWVVSSRIDLYHSKDNSFEPFIAQSPNISNVLKDSKGNLWIGSLTQLRYKDAKTKKTVPIKIANGSLAVSELFEDNEKHIWVGTSLGLFELFFVKKKLVIKKYFTSVFTNVGNSNQITTIKQDKKLRYWIGTKNNGLYLFDKKSRELSHFTKNFNDKNSLINNNIRKILLHTNGTLWIGTQEGLSVLNPNTFQFSNYQHDPAKPNSLSQNSIYDIFQDKNGSVWIGTYFGGVNVVYSVNTPFKTFQNSIDKNSLSSNIISSIIEDSKKNLWIGTEAGGLNYYNRANQQFRAYKNISGTKNSLSSNLVKAIALDKDQNLWIGTALGGLNYLNPKTSNFAVFKQNTAKNSIASDNINCLIVNKQNKVFIGTNMGLNIYDIAQKKFSFHRSKIKKTTLDNPITALFEDKKGNIWLGSQTGIYMYKGSQLEFKNYKDNFNNPFTHSINCFHQDRKGNMWVGTYHNGLAFINVKNNNFKILNTIDGLPSDNILSITEDNNTNLWISTDNGLVKYTPRSRTFRSFNIVDGLSDIQFNTNSFLKDSQGSIFFGTYNGLVSFIPQQIKKNTVPPETVLTNLKLFNIPVKINDETGLLKQDVNFSNTLTFNHNQSIFTIEFAALNFIKSSKNKYAYKLDGFEKNWNYVEIPSATYTNLPAGNYQFLVKSANNDGIWNEKPKKINIELLPPLWKTWWAYLLYLITISIVTYHIYLFFNARSKLKQQLYFEHLEATHQQKSYQMKLDFFTNISHEIRTPLTLILGPIEKLEQLTTENTQANKYALSIKKNTERLYRLVNELLDFRKADSDNLRLYFFEENIVSSLEEIYNYFATLAEEKNIEYLFKTSHPQILVYFDKEQIEKVFFNLLSNAFKFTQNEGVISVEIILKQAQVEITVSDNGKGISIDAIDDIFNNFYQADQSIGTGIGLALSKSLVELHKGEIKVKSTTDKITQKKETTFTVILKLGKNHLSASDIILTSEIENQIYQEVYDHTAERLIDNPDINSKNKDSHILIVEDNDEVRDFIQQSLENQYHIHVSENGLEGWKNAVQTLPDLIISDVMMPIMDGLELCRKLKTDARTSHIPVIMLTAKSAPIHQINGLQHGADLYITKPFNNQILQLNIRNLLSLKAASQKKYSEQLLKLPIITTNESSQDEKFLQKLHQIIEENVANTNLDLAFITSEIGMSKSVLYKKFNALTNLSLNEFIKSQRLKHAVEFFQKGETSIVSVALQVGFNDAKYFSREFKKMYGITPFDYIKNKGKDQTNIS